MDRGSYHPPGAWRKMPASLERAPLSAYFLPVSATSRASLHRRERHAAPPHRAFRVTEAIFTLALRRLLGRLPEQLPPERIDRLWLFSPRDLNGRESGLVVLSLFVEGADESAVRELLTLQYEAEPAANDPHLTYHLTSQGTTPADRIPRLIDGVLARLADEREDPIAEEIDGDLARWSALLARAEATAVDPTR